MTNKEINRDIKRMWKKFDEIRDNLNAHAINTKEYGELIEEKIRPEYLRLAHADNSFKTMNRKSILILIIINRKFQFERQFRFGLNIDETQL